MVDIFIYIPYDDAQNYPFCRLQLLVKMFDTQLNEPTNQNSINIPKVVEPMNKKMIFLGGKGFVYNIVQWKG